MEKKRFDMNAEPVDFLQLAQWQIRKVKGSPLISNFIELHRQDPDRTVVVVVFVVESEEGIAFLKFG